MYKRLTHLQELVDAEEDENFNNNNSNNRRKKCKVVSTVACTLISCSLFGFPRVYNMYVRISEFGVSS